MTLSTGLFYEYRSFVCHVRGFVLGLSEIYLTCKSSTVFTSPVVLAILSDTEEPWISQKLSIRRFYVGTMSFIIIIYYRGLRERAGPSLLLTQSQGLWRKYTGNPSSLVDPPFRDHSWLLHCAFVYLKFLFCLIFARH